MILKIFSPKISAKNLAFWLKTNCDHNIDPLEPTFSF
jgi:hypothetical protein